MPLDKSNILGLCFDVDGTLRDTDDQFVARLTNWLRPFKILLPGSNPQAVARRVVMSTEYPGNFVLGLADRLHLDQSLAKLGDFNCNGYIDDSDVDIIAHNFGRINCCESGEDPCQADFDGDCDVDGSDLTLIEK